MKTTPTQIPSSSTQRLLGRGIALLILFILLWPGAALKASHIVGGDISYKCLGNNKYEITLNVYRDCFYGDPEAWFDNPARVGIYRKSNNTLYQQVNMNITMQDDTLTNFIMDTCLVVPPDACVHIMQYKKVVTIPFDPAGYEIVYQRCCRNITVLNILDPFFTGATYCVNLSGEAMQWCNSSPEFADLGDQAPVVVCVNQPLVYDHSAIDPDGDSLVYRLHTPFTGGTFNNPQPFPPPTLPTLQTVQWNEPTYSEDNMLGDFPNSIPLAIDPITGIITATPAMQGQFVVGIAVEEYRDGVLLSTVRRDFQYTVTECLEVVSSFFAPSSQCDDLTVFFENNSSSLATHFKWYFDWGGDTTLTSAEVNPTFTYPDTGWYTIALIAEPNSQCVDTSFQEIYLQDNSLFADFEFTIFDCVDTTVLACTDLSYDTISPVIAWNWVVTYDDTVTVTSSLKDPTFLLPKGKTGTVSLTVLSLNGCEQTLSFPIETGTDFPISLFADTLYICLGDSVSLNPMADSIGMLPYYWEPDSLFADPTLPNQVVAPDSNTVYSVTITAPDSICFAQTDITVIVKSLPELSFTYDVDCNGSTVNFTNTSNSSEGYFWNFGDPTTDADTSLLVDPVYNYPDTGTYLVILSTGPGAICPDTITQPVELLENILSASFTYELNDCEIDSAVVHFIDQSENALGNTIAWDWDFGPYGVSNEQNPTITVFQNDTIQVMYTITTDEGCQDSITQEIIVTLPEDEFIVDSIVICLGDSAALNPGGNPNFDYLWTPSTGLSDATAANPLAFPSQTTTYTVTVAVPNFSTCFITREVEVTVPPAINLLTTGDVTTCDPMVTLNALTSVPTTITWNFQPGGPLTGDEIMVPVSGITEYTVTAEDAFGCIEEVMLTVQGGPVDYAMSADSVVICSDEPFDIFVTNLDPNDVLTYQWDPNPAILSGGDTNDPVISNEPGQTVLYVNMENQFGCVAADSVYLAIIDANIQLDFDYEIVSCDGLTVQFTNLSEFAFDYVWDFGDPTTTDDISFEENPVYTYPYIDTFLVTLDIIHNAECVDPITKPVELIDPVLIADFRFGFTDCSEGFVTIFFEDMSQNFLNNTTGWFWTFSTGETSTEQNPTITVDSSQILTATLLITTALNCQDSVTYDIPIELTEVNLEDTIILCYGDTAFLNPLGNPNYQYNWSPATGLSDPTAVNPQVFTTETTTYTVDITNFIGDTCEITKTITVVVPPQILLDANGGMAVACNEPINLEVSANISPLDFVWTNVNGDTIGFDTLVTVSPTNTSTYYVTATDSLGCSVSDTVVVTVPTQIEVFIEGEFISCQSDVSLTAISNADPVSFEWFSGGILIDTSATITVNPGVTTVYTVIATDTFGCQAVADSVVTVPPTIELEVSDTLISCQLPVELVATGNVPLDYQWTTIGGQILSLDSAFSIQPDSTSWFYVNVVDEFGCTAQDSALIIVPPPIEVSVEGFTVSCQEEVTLFAISNISPVTYQWSPGGSTADSLTVNPGLTTLYTVVVTDTFGCQASDTALVVVPTEIELTVSDDQISCKTDVTLSASGNVPLIYQWFIDTVLVDTVPIITVNPGVTTVYTILVTDSLGCQALDSVLVTVPPDIEMDVTPDTVACEGPIVLSASGNVPLNFEWWQSGSIDTTYNSQITVLPDTTSWYYVLGIDSFGCEALDSVFVTNGIVDIQTEGQVIVCPDDSITLEVTNLDPFDMLTYQWTAGTGGSIIGDDTLAIVTVNSIPGSVEFYVVATNQFGCVATDTAEVIMSDFDPVVSDTVNVCKGIPTPINPNGNPNYVYNWEPVIGGMDPASPNPVVVLFEDQTFSVTITDFEGVDTCSAVLEVTVLVNPDIELEAAGDTTLCEYVPTTLSATAGVSPVTYIWYDDPGLTNVIGTDSVIIHTPTGSVIYTVIAEDALGCLDTAMVEVNAFPIDITTIPNYDLCLDEELVIGVINNAPDQTLTYDWWPDDSIVEGDSTATPTVNPNESTTYTVVVENQYGCIDSASTFVNVIDIITGLFAEAEPDSILFNSGETSQLTTVQDNDYSYYWWPDDGSLTDNTIYNPIAEPDTTTTYYIEIVDQFGCRGLDSVTVVVWTPPCDRPHIFVPSGFTPNGDGENDILYVRGDNIDVMHFVVYSRWGQLIFESFDKNIGWDGTFKGEPLPPDVFGWYLEVKCYNGEDFTDKGNVTLLR